jgi:hypothetical protein
VRISPILRWSHDLAAAGLPKWQVVSLRLDRQHRGLLCVACECQLPTAKAARLTTCIWRRWARLHMHKHISPSMADCMSLMQARISRRAQRWRVWPTNLAMRKIVCSVIFATSCCFAFQHEVYGCVKMKTFWLLVLFDLAEVSSSGRLRR